MMAPTELVKLVNEWGTLPRTADGRPPAPPHHELATLADELHPVFAATTPSAQAALVTALLQTTAVRPELTFIDKALAASWLVEDPAQRHRASAALTLRHHLAEHPGRLGVCADPQCADVYIDASPAGRRRFCCLTCQNRSRAATFRRRRATPPP